MKVTKFFYILYLLKKVLICSLLRVEWYWTRLVIRHRCLSTLSSSLIYTISARGDTVRRVLPLVCHSLLYTTNTAYIVIYCHVLYLYVCQFPGFSRSVSFIRTCSPNDAPGIVYGHVPLVVLLRHAAFHAVTTLPEHIQTHLTLVSTSSLSRPTQPSVQFVSLACPTCRKNIYAFMDERCDVCGEN